MLLAPFAFSGGIVTNTNQSAAWARYFSRYATTDIDAVYFNPAGLTKLNDGFHFSINNQSIFQTWTISNDFALLNHGPDYIGDVKAPMFPSVYGAYKTGKLAISVGFNPIGGGGGATFDVGLPAFELMSGAALVQSLNEMNIPTTQYTLDSQFEGQSIYWGLQVGLTYEINDMISVFAGARYVMAGESYTGYLKNMMIDPTHPTFNPTGAMTSAPLFFTNVATGYNQLHTGLQAGIDGGIWTGADIVTEPTAMGTLVGMGYDPLTTTNDMAITIFQGGEATSTATAALTSDQNVEYSESGTGITPIFGIHFTPSDKFDIALKYELKTKMEFTKETVDDFLIGFETDGTPVTMFPDGEVTHADMPASLSGGVNFRPLDGLQVSGGFEYYFDQDVDWDGREEFLESNLYTLNFSAQYDISEKFLVSGGYSFSKTGATDDYQSDLSFSLSSSAIGFGGAYNINENIQVNLGYAMVFYTDDEVPGTGYTTTYGKKTDIFAAGINFSF